ncbi:MAG: pyridoxamine 5'-phosphate oxidase family protein [Chitinophagaceae bacterium]
MFGTLNEQEIEELLHDELVGRIGCHAGDTTYVVPISYAYDGQFVYGRTFEGMKVALMRQNPAVCFQVDNTRNLANWKSVIGWGEVEELSDEAARKKALHCLNARLLPAISSATMRVAAAWPFTDDEDDKAPGILFRIRLTTKTGRFERNNDGYFFAS